MSKPAAYLPFKKSSLPRTHCTHGEYFHDALNPVPGSESSSGLLCISLCLVSKIAAPKDSLIKIAGSHCSWSTSEYCKSQAA